MHEFSTKLKLLQIKYFIYRLGLIFIFFLLISSNCQHTQNESKRIQINEEEQSISNWPNDQRMVVNISVDLHNLYEGIDLNQVNVSDQESLQLQTRNTLNKILSVLDKYFIRATMVFDPSFVCNDSTLTSTIINGGHEIAGFYSDDIQEGISYLAHFDCLTKSHDYKIKGIFGETISTIVEQNLISDKSNLTYWAGFSNKNSPQLLGDSSEFIVLIPSHRLEHKSSSNSNNNNRKFILSSDLISSFDNLYDQSLSSRIMMGVCISGVSSTLDYQLEALEYYIQHVKNKDGVVFMRNSDIARLIEKDPDTHPLIPMTLDQEL